MKRIVIIIFIIVTTHIAFGQEKFVVPQVTDLQKYQNAALQLNGSYLIQISYAKSLGKTVENVGSYVGDQLKYTWERTGGFNGFVQGMMYTMVTLVPYGSIEINTQTDKSIECTVVGLYPDLKEGGSVFNVTYEEYLKFLGTVFTQVGDYMGATYTQNDTEEGLVVKIRQK